MRATSGPSAGEWYLDSTAGELYTVVAANATPPKTVFAPVVETLFRVEGTQDSPVVGFRLSGVTLRHAAPTYMANYSVGSGQWQYSIPFPSCFSFQPPQT